MCCGAGDPVVFHTLLLAVAHDLRLEGNAGLTTRTLQVPVDRDLVARDDAAPVGAQQDVVDGRAARLHTGAGERLPGFGGEAHRKNPRGRWWTRRSRSRPGYGRRPGRP